MDKLTTVYAVFEKDPKTNTINGIRLYRDYNNATKQLKAWQNEQTEVYIKAMHIED